MITIGVSITARILFVPELHCYGARVGFETPSFEIVIDAASRVILNSAVNRLPAFSKREDCDENYVHGAS
jgi:hypothetical protein